MTDFANISLEIAQFAATAESGDSLPAWFIVEAARDIPGLAGKSGAGTKSMGKRMSGKNRRKEKDKKSRNHELAIKKLEEGALQGLLRAVQIHCDNTYPMKNSDWAYVTISTSIQTVMHGRRNGCT